MDARRWKTEDKVSWLQSWARQQRPALRCADGEAGDVEIASRVKAGHLRRLSAYQCATRLGATLGNALHNRGCDFLIQLPRCKIIQEKQRLRPLDDNVVDAHGHQINADSVVQATLNRDLHLCANAVIGGDQDRVDEPRRLKI